MKKRLSSLFYAVLLVAIASVHANTINYQDALELEQVAFLDCMFTTLNGQSKEITIPYILIESAIKHGLAFDGSSIPGMTQITQSDMLLKLNMDTLTILPWTDNEQKTARVICDVYRNENSPYEGDVRYFLKQILLEARSMGYDFRVGPELEFFICNDNYRNKKGYKPCDTDNYFAVETNPHMAAFKRTLFNALLCQDIPIEKIHHEVAPGQYEVSIKYANALTVADQLMIAKQTIRAIAHVHSFKTTFMPKPFYGENGSGMHIHFSLWDTTTGQNAFYDKDDPAHLSPLAKHFIAGVLTHIHEFNALFNPSINSYKRLVGFEAPSTICWATKNRSAMIRIPQINSTEQSAARAEIRLPDPLCCPYLAFAILLKLGLEGIKNKTPLAPPVENNLYHIGEAERTERNIKKLPSSLENALAIFEQSSFARELLGNTLHTEFVQCKKQDVVQYNTSITNWELNKYFES